MNRLPKELQCEAFQKLFTVADVESLSPEQRAEYEHSLKNYRDLVNSLDCARGEGIAEGMAKGKAEGIAEGIEKGKAEGIAEGMEKGMEKGKIEDALNMKADGLSTAQISKYTGLTLEQVEAL